MEPFVSDLLKSFIQVLFLLGASLVVIWYYLRCRSAGTRTTLDLPRAAGSPGDVILTLRLQACERLILFLERITPNNLILRVNTPDMTARQLQGALIRTVREEFDYNLSQQLYVSATTWERVRSAKEETISLINRAGSELREEAVSRDMAAAILKLSIEKERSPIGLAIEALKREIG